MPDMSIQDSRDIHQTNAPTNQPGEISRDALQAWYVWAQGQIPAHRQLEGQQELAYLLQEVTSLTALNLKLGAWEDAHISSRLGLEDLTQLWEIRWRDQIPLQQLLGYTYWREFKLTVSRDVLIPRPETEYLIDLADNHSTEIHKTGIWLDLGTGSGALAIGLATMFPQATVLAVDLSPKALKIAQENIKAYQLQDRIQLRHGAWWEPLQNFQGKIAGVVANPPYIPQDLLNELQPEVQHHEPKLALISGDHGLADLRDIINSAPDFLLPNGLLILEMMTGQGEAVRELILATGAFDQIEILKDLAGHDRYGLAWRKP